VINTEPSIPPIQYFAVHRTEEISRSARSSPASRRIAAIFRSGGFREGVARISKALNNADLG
jgi:hypothetical protein